MIMKRELLIAGCYSAGIILIIIACIFRIKRSNSSCVPEDEHSEFLSSVPKENACQKIPIKEIYAATDFLSDSNFIGQGITGMVYKGILTNGWEVAIKRMAKDSNRDTFLREVTALSYVRHPNLVILRGYCEKEDECFLVYELCANGNLSEWLYGKDRLLTWLQRLEIAVGSARGLCFLHTYPRGRIVHRDIKPTNILIGSDFQAKLSDFGLSKVMEAGVSFVSSEVRGTFGYVDPQYRTDCHVNAASDVYSFGIVLLQILSGKKVIGFNDIEPLSLDKMAKLLLRNGNTSELADPRLGGDYSKEAFDIVLKLAISCTSYKNHRPTMEIVLQRLEEALLISRRASKFEQVSIISAHSLTIKE